MNAVIARTHTHTAILKNILPLDRKTIYPTITLWKPRNCQQRPIDWLISSSCSGRFCQVTGSVTIIPQFLIACGVSAWGKNEKKKKRIVFIHISVLRSTVAFCSCTVPMLCHAPNVKSKVKAVRRLCELNPKYDYTYTSDKVAVHVIQLQNKQKTKNKTILVKWIKALAIGLHISIRPLCYSWYSHFHFIWMRMRNRLFNCSDRACAPLVCRILQITYSMRM